MREFTIKVPDVVNPTEDSQREAQELVVSYMYKKGLISSQEACQVISATRMQFEEEILPKFGYSIFPSDPETIDNEFTQE